MSDMDCRIHAKRLRLFAHQYCRAVRLLREGEIQNVDVVDYRWERFEAERQKLIAARNVVRESLGRRLIRG